MPKDRINLRIDADLHAAAKAKAKDGPSVTAQVEQALADALGLDPKPDSPPPPGMVDEADSDPEVEKLALEIAEQGDATGMKHGLSVARMIARQRLGVANPNREAVKERAAEMMQDDRQLSRRAAERLAARELFLRRPLFTVGHCPELRTPAEREKILKQFGIKGDPPPKAA